MQYWNNSYPKYNFGYSGVSILTKFKPLKVTYGIGNKVHDAEGRVITLEFQNFYLVAVYVPNSGRKLVRIDYRTKEWDTDFKTYLGTLENKNVIVAGDLNVSHKDMDIYNAKNKER